jgi:hypothetical protein
MYAPRALPPLFRSPPQRAAAVVVAVLVGAIGFLPLFGGPGYEHALASGILVPSAAAIATALELSARRDVTPLQAVGRGILSGTWLASIAFATALLHGARVGICDLSGGAFDFALGPGVGCLLGGVWGAVVAEACRDRRRWRLLCVVLGLALPLAGVVISVARFYTSPMIFAFDPFVGYFSGTLYDTVIDAGPALLTYRAGSLATLVGIALAASVLERRPPNARLYVAPITKDLGIASRALLAGLALATSVAVTVMGAKLGHWQTASTIARELGGERAGARCDLVYPDSLRPTDAALLLKDCEEQLASVEAYLGARGPDRVRAYFFRDAGEKKRLMGAGDTYIAKPWRHEVYLQLGTYPHPVLGHELAHVVAGSFARGPFRIAGGAFGIWPNPGLIEGTAVAASPDDDELTDLQWARAMMDLGILPPIAKIFSFDFLGQNSSKSYTIAGAFVRWTIERHGAATVRAWYGGGDLEALTKSSWSELDTAFRNQLATLVLSPEADAFAKAKFERPSVFARRCPHVIDALKRDAQRCEGEQRIERALELYDQVLARDAHDTGARYHRAATELRYGESARETTHGQKELVALVDDASTPRTWKDKSEEALADDDLLAGRFASAEARYRALAARSLDEDAARTLEVKALAATELPARRAVEALLIGAPRRAADPWLGAIWLGVWSAQESDPLADYLIGKNLAQHAWFALAANFLDRALGSPWPTARVGRELVRQRGIVACAMGDMAEVGRVRAIVRADAGPFRGSAGGRLEWIERLLARCH